MWTENTVLEEDMKMVLECPSIEWDRFQDKTILITGATGLIGSNLIAALAFADLEKGLNLKIIALVRDEEAAVKKFSRLLMEYPGLVFAKGTVEDLPEMEEDIEFFIHAASPTASGYFIQKPAETIRTAVCGTMNVLDMAKEKQAEGVAYLSSMEVYGSQEEEKRLSEEDTGCMDPLSVRSSYPESKRMCESLAAAYAAEYGLPVSVVRLAQTFGPGVNIDTDTRVFAEFARCMEKGEDIVLLTEGKSKRGYLYTADAVTAILTVLLKGEPGTAYNAMNESTYCSITEMAGMIAEDLCNGEIKVRIEIDETAGKKFSPLHFYRLNTDRLCQEGWLPKTGLAQMYLRMTSAWKQEKEQTE